MPVYNSTILEYRLEGKLSVELELHLVKTEILIIRAHENPTRVPNKVKASMVFPFWPGHPVRKKNLLVKGRLRRAQWYVIEFELFGSLSFPRSCKNIENSSHFSGSIFGRMGSKEVV